MGIASSQSFVNLVVCTVLHTLMSLNGCIRNLMKPSGLEILDGAAFSGLTSIMNGKAWVRSMRAFRMVTAALLYDFLKDGPKTFEDISQVS